MREKVAGVILPEGVEGTYSMDFNTNLYTEVADKFKAEIEEKSKDCLRIDQEWAGKVIAP